MSETYQCPCTMICPLLQAMQSIGGKWKIPILCALASEAESVKSTPGSDEGPATGPVSSSPDLPAGMGGDDSLCRIKKDGSAEPPAHRYNDILKKVRGISNTMLAKSLKELENDGLVTRHEYVEVPVRVEYSLTEKGLSLQPILADLAGWYSRQ